MDNKIEVGDLVEVYFSSGNTIVGVLDVIKPGPQSPWRVIQEGCPVIFNDYQYMVRIEKGGEIR